MKTLDDKCIVKIILEESKERDLCSECKGYDPKKHCYLPYRESERYKGEKRNLFKY